MRLALGLALAGSALVGGLCACGPGTAARVKANEETVRRYSEEVGNKGNLAVIDEVLAEDYVRHCQATGPDVHGREAMKALYRQWHATFSDYHETVEFAFGDGTYVAAYLTVGGRQTGRMGPFPPSGKPMLCRAVAIHRFEGGKIAETWAEWDNLAALTQLGHLPPPPAAP